MSKVLLGLLVLILAVFLVSLWPLAAVWSVNTLFQTQIPYTFRTWLAVVVLFTLARLVARPFGRNE